MYYDRGGVLLGFSGVSPCFAHDSGSVSSHASPETTVKDVTAPDDETNIRSLLEHVKHHIGTSKTIDEGSLAFKEYTREGGTWKSGSLYVITTDLEGRAFLHGGYSLIGKNSGLLSGIKDDNGKPVVEELLDKAKDKETVCVDYVYNGVSRVSCGFKFQELVTDTDRLLIFGFDHAEADPAIRYAECPEFTPSITAAQVMDDNTLQEFVKEGLSYLLDLFILAKGNYNEALTYRSCIRKEPWKSGAIYMFAMTSTTQVFFNGLLHTLEDTNLNVVDEDGVNVGDEIIKTATGTGVGGFVDYKWDHPLIDGDEVREDGKSPGTTPKRSYVEGFSFPGGEQVFIMGSGIYPGDYTKAEDDDGGCAIVGIGSGTGNTALNLLLVVSALFLAAFFRRKPLDEKQM